MKENILKNSIKNNNNKNNNNKNKNKNKNQIVNKSKNKNKSKNMISNENDETCSSDDVTRGCQGNKQLKCNTSYTYLSSNVVAKFKY